MLAPETSTSTSRAGTSEHSLIPYLTTSREEIKSIFSIQVVESIS